MSDILELLIECERHALGDSQITLAAALSSARKEIARLECENEAMRAVLSNRAKDLFAEVA